MIKFAVLLLAASFASAKMPRLPLRTNRMVMGWDADDGEYPFALSLREVGENPGHFCGASILTDTWGLTSAFCCELIDNDRDFYAYAGSVYLDRGGSKHTIVKVFPHPRYSLKDMFNNDICVFKVATPFRFSNRVGQVTLGPEDAILEYNDTITAMGWGATSVDESKQDETPNRMQKGNRFKGLERYGCYLSTGVLVKPVQICVQGEYTEQTLWIGDGGGPLIKNGAQVAIASFVFEPYTINLPTVVTRSTLYNGWIKETLGPDASKLKFQ